MLIFRYLSIPMCSILLLSSDRGVLHSPTAENWWRLRGRAVLINFFGLSLCTRFIIKYILFRIFLPREHEGNVDQCNICQTRQNDTSAESKASCSTNRPNLTSPAVVNRKPRCSVFVIRFCYSLSFSFFVYSFSLFVLVCSSALGTA